MKKRLINGLAGMNLFDNSASPVYEEIVQGFLRYSFKQHMKL